MANLWDCRVGKGLSRTDTHLDRQSGVDVFPMGVLRAVEYAVLPYAGSTGWSQPMEQLFLALCNGEDSGVGSAYLQPLIPLTE